VPRLLWSQAHPSLTPTAPGGNACADHSASRVAALATALPLGFFTAPAKATPLPSAPTVTLVRTVLAKVDGDNKSDTVKLFSLGANVYKLQVTTNTGKISSAQFTSALPADEPTPFYGAASLDGVKGKELLVKIWPASGFAPVTLRTYTWREGKLVAEAAPTAPNGKVWTFDDGTMRVYGHRFYTSHGRRYVEAASLVQKTTSSPWTGKIVGSVWRNGKWVKTSTRSVKLSAKASIRYRGLSGVELLLGNLRTDIDGDHAADRVDFFLHSYRLSTEFLGQYGVRVATAKKTPTRSFWTSRLTGDNIAAGSFDGVAGKELAFTAYADTAEWTVFTWRSGKLVNAAAPSICGVTPNVWQGCSDEAPTYVNFSVSAGKSYALAVTLNPPMTFGSFRQSVWQNGTWVLVSTWSRDVTPADAPLLHDLTAPDLVHP